MGQRGDSCIWSSPIPLPAVMELPLPHSLGTEVLCLSPTRTGPYPHLPVSVHSPCCSVFLNNCPIVRDREYTHHNAFSLLQNETEPILTRFILQDIAQFHPVAEAWFSGSYQVTVTDGSCTENGPVCLPQRSSLPLSGLRLFEHRVPQIVKVHTILALQSELCPLSEISAAPGRYHSTLFFLTVGRCCVRNCQTVSSQRQKSHLGQA